jgi:hypothetical protein
MYTFVDFTSQIVGRRGVPCPTNKGVSYTNLVWLDRDLKNRLLLLLLMVMGQGLAKMFTEENERISCLDSGRGKW